MGHEHVVTAASGRGRRRVALRRSLRCYLYLAPTFILLAIFSYYPPILAFIRAFYEWDGAYIKEFVGLDHFRAMIDDEVLIESIRNQIKLSIFGGVISIFVPLLIAELIFSLKSDRAKYWYRILVVVPMVVPMMVVLLLWQFVYDPNVGLLNAVLGWLGLPPQTWLHDFDLALYSIMFIGFPFVAGINVLIVLAGLNNIGTAVFEAAKIDGASFIVRLFKIDIPLLVGQIKILAVLAIIGSINNYQLQLILTDGGPGYSTMTPGLHMYHHAFHYNHLGYACALGIVLFVVIFALSFASDRILKDRT